jgi:hypothetical protein
MASQVVGIVSALGIVAAFAALQLDLVGPHDLRYLLANLLCAGGLTTIAVLETQYGFVISNGFWTLVAAVGISRAIRTSRVRGTASEGDRSRPGKRT